MGGKHEARLQTAMSSIQGMTSKLAEKLAETPISERVLKGHDFNRAANALERMLASATEGWFWTSLFTCPSGKFC
jgi:hypothetical protein